jgi:hypothetical protein
MPLRREEIRNFIKVCEQIQALLAQGAKLTEDERELIESCAGELIDKLQGAAS